MCWLAIKTQLTKHCSNACFSGTSLSFSHSPSVLIDLSIDSVTTLLHSRHFIELDSLYTGRVLRRAMGHIHKPFVYTMSMNATRRIGMCTEGNIKHILPDDIFSWGILSSDDVLPVAYSPLGELGDGPAPFENLLFVFFCYIANPLSICICVIWYLNWQRESGHN